ncbi:JMJD7 [Branchiostoma lanceolatum]|uniref:JMJD7 protein n=1 Tax=Branchiostoma lanceolatum TaxID=7740 RepID=A0A8K0AB10_BRALA|nr:JMJD7 [Branchiostoma lanceolatum]
MARVKRVLYLIAFFLAASLTSSDDPAKESDTEAGKEDGRVEQGATTWPPSDVTLEDDPSLWPGHLKPLGANVPNKEVKILQGFPPPEVFLRDYAIPSVPVLFKAAVTDSTAFKTWNSDEYFRQFSEAGTLTHTIETRKKEIRTQPPTDMTLRQFLDRYSQEDIYMVEGVPKFLRKDVPMPKALLCEPLTKMLVDTVMWFSSGGTKSVLHNDDVDNINCLYDGKKELVFISFQRYRDKVTLDHPEGSYSSIDVDAVDFTKFPGMREVEYHRVNMTAGDCLYIPYRWFHQVNSYGRNIAVNVWWEHNLRKYVEALSQDCGDLSEDSTLNDFQIEVPPEHNEPLMGLNELLDGGKDEVVTYQVFEAKVKEDKLLSELIIWTPECTQLVEEMFEEIDRNKDSVFTPQELEGLTKEMQEELDEVLMDKLEGIRSIIIEQVAQLRESVAAEVAEGRAESYVELVKKMLQEQRTTIGDTEEVAGEHGHQEL